ncbi:DUF5397 family protein [Methylorubrum podarium]|jgi:Family of unknown function (DUF5397)|uniref:DUF5397 family protein n=1 Tax=Methylorubrum podarium TaxID=200476 RepID=UPI001EE206D0|nr:DUF5397 family protein [Methylorubrum podarium]GJE70128.1 hypothetical protein CHKEEEPN_1662 [Methylorubrum podarium]
MSRDNPHIGSSFESWLEAEGIVEDVTMAMSAWAKPHSLIGTWRRFGSAGPIYEIVGKGEPSTGASSFMRVRVVETGEELAYPLAHILDDPKVG